MACDDEAEAVEGLRRQLADLRRDHKDLTGGEELGDATGGTGYAGTSAQVNEVRLQIIDTQRALAAAREALNDCRKAENASGTPDIGSGSSNL